MGTWHFLICGMMQFLGLSKEVPALFNKSHKMCQNKEINYTKLAAEIDGK
jgi:hypothetical protein